MPTQRAVAAPTLTDLLFDRADVGLCLVAPDGTILRANAEWLRSTGFSLDQVLGTDIIDLFPATRDLSLALHARARAGNHVEVSRHAQFIEGGETWWDGCIDPVSMEGGTGLLIAAREVSHPERQGLPTDVSASLRHEQEKYRALFEHSLDAVYLILADGTFVDANAAACRMHGMTIEEIKERGCVGTVVRDERYAAALKERATSGNVRAELTHLRKDGTKFPVEIESVKLCPQRPDSPTFVIARDITERKRAEEALRDAEARFRAFMDNSPATAWAKDEAGRYVYVSPAYERQLGVRRGDLVGTTDCELWPPEVASEFRENDLTVMRDGKLVQVIETSRTVDGTEHWWYASKFPFRDAQGHTYVGGIGVDVTDRVVAEEGLRRANEQLREADRRKDEFLAMLSHELRNPLAPIRNAAYVLEHADPNSDQAARARGVLRRQSEHLTRLVDDLLDVTRITRGKISLQRSRLDLREAVVRAAEDFRLMMADRGITFRTALPELAVWVNADATRVNQVVANLLHNAAKFTPRRGEVVVSLRQEKGTAEIRVQDTGSGIGPDLLPRLFGPFVQGELTLARSEGGLGLGLALVKGIVDLHGGEVRVESAGVGKGAEFLVRLPVHGPAAALSGRDTGEEQIGKGGRRVLVVDDNADAADSLADVLRLQGHVVDVAFDGPSALAKLDTTSPDAVLCDIGMPGMSGYELAKAIRAGSRGSVQLVALSGYAQPDHVKRAMEAGFDAHVAKPPDPDEIARLLAR